MMAANYILIKEFSKLYITFPQSPQKHYFSAPGIIFIQTLTFKKNKPVQKRNKAQHQAAMAKVASGQRQLSFFKTECKRSQTESGDFKQQQSSTVSANVVLKDRLQIISNSQKNNSGKER